MSEYKVCILAAGVGSETRELTKNVHQGILPVNFKGIISYIIEKFPSYIEIVIAIGHQKQTIKDYLELAYPERKFIYVEVDNYIGPNTGPGHSLLACKNYLQCPFIFSTADTITLEDIPKPDENWIGIAPVKETEKYCTVKIKNNLIYQLDDKIKTDNKFAFIGLAGIKDYEEFWNALEKISEVKGVVRDISGFKALIEKKLAPIDFTWFDTGSIDKYIETNKNFSGGEKKFDFSKNDEFLYFVNGRVIKFFADANITKKKYERSLQLKGLCPPIENYKNNFYSYKKVDGNTLYNTLNSQIITDFLKWAKMDLWKISKLSDKNMDDFKKTCYDFYFTKTMKRLNSFYEKNNIEDGPNIINGSNVPPLKSLLDQLDWNYIIDGIPARFHGDFTLANILVTRDEKTQLVKFILLDWRHEFGGSIEIGDVYYDLAKFYKGIILSDELIKEGMFTFDMSGASIYYDYFLNKGLIDAKEEFEKFVINNKYDLNKVKIITAITLLNMSPLHHYPFNFLVYYLGKNLLYKTLGEKNVSK